MTDGTTPYRPRRARPGPDEEEPATPHADHDSTDQEAPDSTAQHDPGEAGPGEAHPFSRWAGPVARDESGHDDAGHDDAGHDDAEDPTDTAPAPAAAAGPGNGATDGHDDGEDDRGAETSTTADLAHGPNPRTSVLVGVVATVLVVVMAIGYAGSKLTGTGIAATVPGGEIGSVEPTAAPTPEPLTQERMLNQVQARPMVQDATWAVAMSQSGLDESSPAATCLAQAAADQTAPVQTELRTLTASGSRSMSVLHQADLFADSESAIAVFSERAKALGGCDTETAYLMGSDTITGLGNQALSVSVSVIREGKPEYHTVVLARTGRLLNVLDAATTDKPVDPRTEAASMAQIVNSQCVDSGGLCASTPGVTPVVPPIGGDAPGLPVVADIPRLPNQTGRWSATEPVRNPSEIRDGSQCTRIGGVTVEPSTTLTRTYLVQDDEKIPQIYGWDVVVFTVADANAATAFVGEVDRSVTGCKDRQRTASITKTADITGTGARATAINGKTWTIRQQTGPNAATDYLDFRVAISAVGNKVVYQFLPLEQRIDFTDAQWQSLTVRAAQRATQIN